MNEEMRQMHRIMSFNKQKLKQLNNNGFANPVVIPQPDKPKIPAKLGYPKEPGDAAEKFAEMKRKAQNERTRLRSHEEKRSKLKRSLGSTCDISQIFKKQTFTSVNNPNKTRSIDSFAQQQQQQQQNSTDPPKADEPEPIPTVERKIFIVDETGEKVPLDAIDDKLILKAAENLIGPLLIGCGNHPRCGADECDHDADIRFSPLERRINSRRSSTKRVISQLAMDPFIDIEMDLKRVPNRLNQSELLLERRNDDYTLLRTMSTGVSADAFACQFINLRRLYATELADIGKRAREEVDNAQTIYEHFVLAEKASPQTREQLNVRINEAELLKNQRCESASHDCVRAHYCLREKARSRIVQILNATRVPIAASFNVVSDQLLSVCELLDGHSRNDLYFVALANEVLAGKFDNVFAETRREAAEISGNLAQFEPGEMHIDAALSDRLIASRPRTALEIMRERQAAIDAQDKKEEQGVIYEPSTVVHVDPSKYIAPRQVTSSWGFFAADIIEVCPSQNTVENGAEACSAIAFVTAFYFMHVEKAEEVRDLKFVRYVTNGARLWTTWAETAKDKSVYMMASEVPPTSEKLREMLGKMKCRFKELSGPLSERYTTGTESEVDNNPLFSEALERIEKKAKDRRFASILTVQNSSFCVARIENKYFLFDSHSRSFENKMAVLMTFESRELLCSAVRMHFPPVGVSNAEGQLHADIEKNSYSLYAIYIKNEQQQQ